jgi:hypothetical protein
MLLHKTWGGGGGRKEGEIMKLVASQMFTYVVKFSYLFMNRCIELIKHSRTQELHNTILLSRYKIQSVKKKMRRIMNNIDRKDLCDLVCSV